MSSTAISLGREIRIPQPGSVQSNRPATRFDTGMIDNPNVRETRNREDSSFLYTAACEVDLLAAARGGDEDAFVELYKRHNQLLKRRISRIVRNPEDAEDVLQDTLLRAYRGLAGFRAQCSFRTWIMTIATNNSLMLLRRQKSRPETGFGTVTSEGKEMEILQVSDPNPNPEQVCARRQASHRISQAISMLPQGVRLLVELYHRDEVTLVDAANAIGITVAAAKTRLLRARRKLRRRLTNS
jgi:RNA polymerase sigma-70 factor, ECF subfamily